MGECMLIFLNSRGTSELIHQNAKTCKSYLDSIKGALSHFRIPLSILLIILNNLQVIQVLAAK